jgi:hypothetical protein
LLLERLLRVGGFSPVSFLYPNPLKTVLGLVEEFHLSDGFRARLKPTPLPGFVMRKKLLVWAVGDIISFCLDSDFSLLLLPCLFKCGRDYTLFWKTKKVACDEADWALPLLKNVNTAYLPS